MEDEMRNEASAEAMPEITPFLVKRRNMSELSEYFGRDARRYDNGFDD